MKKHALRTNVVRIRAGAAIATLLIASTAYCQNFPTRPVRIVTGSPGGGVDFDARLIAQGITGPLGQPVIVDNRSASVAAAEIVSKAPPDGHTLLVSGTSLWTSSLLRKTPYDVDRDFAPVTLIEWAINVVVVHPSFPAKSIKELIAYAKAKPGQINYASSAVGGTTHLATELFNYMSGVNLVHVPYGGNSQAIAAIIGSESQIYFGSIGVVLPFVKSGKLRALAVTSKETSPLLPGVPTVTESGVPGYESVGITALFTTAGTPVSTIRRLNQEMVRVLKTPESRDQLLKLGLTVIASSPEELGAIVKSERERLGKVIREAKIVIPGNQ